MASAYLEFIRIRFLVLLAYRVNYYSGIIIYILNIGIYYSVCQAIYGAQETLAGFTVNSMTTYIAVSWMARAFYFNTIDRDIATEIRDGSLAIQFIRPYHYLLVKMMQAFGEGLFRLLLLMVPGMVIACLLFPVQLPQKLELWLIFGVMLFMSLLINSQLNMLTGLTAFFIENNEGIIRMKRVIVDLLSGVLLPLSFFPSWLFTVNEWLPFQAITYLPSSVFAGRMTDGQIWIALQIQLLWSFLLIIPVVLLWRYARRRLFIQGG